MKNTREDRVKCAGGGAGKLHVKKNHSTCWCGRQWTQVVGVPGNRKVKEMSQVVDCKLVGKLMCKC